MVRATAAFVLCLSLCGAAHAQNAAPGGAAVAPDSSLLAAELEQLERERAELSLGGPIAMLIGGGVLLASGGALLLFTAMSEAWCAANDGFETRCSGPDDAFYLVGGMAMLGGAVLAIVGLIELLDRARERRRLGVRIKELRRLLGAGAAYGLHLGAELGAERAGFAVQLRL